MLKKFFFVLFFYFLILCIIFLTLPVFSFRFPFSRLLSLSLSLYISLGVICYESFWPDELSSSSCFLSSFMLLLLFVSFVWVVNVVEAAQLISAVWSGRFGARRSSILRRDKFRATENRRFDSSPLLRLGGHCVRVFPKWSLHSVSSANSRSPRTIPGISETSNLPLS